jgi:hypothetical protein
MNRIVLRPAAIALAALALSCATSKELARRSDVYLEKGDVDRAYDTARAALDKDSGNAQALAVMTRAAEVRMDDWRRRIRNLAGVDTVAAAGLTVQLDAFRVETGRYRLVLEEDAAFARDEVAIRLGAARDRYAAAEAALADERPKHAYKLFQETRRYVPHFLDVDDRTDEAWRLAETRVAVLPFDDQTGVPGLARELADAWDEELSKRVQKEGLEFTRMIPIERVYEKLSVAQLGRLDADEAIAIGRRIGATRVVWGTLAGLRSDGETYTDRRPVYRRVKEKGEDGRDEERWEESELIAILREREVRVTCTVEVLDVDREELLAEDTHTHDARARTVFTSFRFEGDEDDWALYPPSLKARSSSDANEIDQEWKSRYGTWTLPKLLDRSRSNPEQRRRYRPENRHEFMAASAPVFLDDLPSTDDLARIALAGSWKPAMDMLRRLDQE